MLKDIFNFNFINLTQKAFCRLMIFGPAVSSKGLLLKISRVSYLKGRWKKQELFGQPDRVIEQSRTFKSLFQRWTPKAHLFAFCKIHIVVLDVWDSRQFYTTCRCGIPVGLIPNRVGSIPDQPPSCFLDYFSIEMKFWKCILGNWTNTKMASIGRR